MDIKELNINEVSADSLNIVEKDTKDLGGKKVLILAQEQIY